jgi:protein-disulfide isomerase
VTSRGQKLFVALALAAILVIVAIVVSQGGAGDDDSGEDPNELAAQFDGIEQSGMVLGDPNADITVTEFADPQCPFCRDFATNVLPDVIDEYVRPGTINLDFQVLTFIGPDSEALARLIAAASLQDLAWETLDLAYARQGTENSGYATEEFLTEIANDVPGLDADRALADRTSPEVDRILDEANNRAEEAAVEATPSFTARVVGGEDQPMELESLDFAGFEAALEPFLPGS